MTLTPSLNIKQHIAELMALAKDGRRTAQARKAAIQEIARLRARGQRDRNVTNHVPVPVHVPAAPSVLEPALAPTPAPDDSQKAQVLAVYETYVAEGDLERAQAAETVLRRNGWWTEPQEMNPVTVTEPSKPEARDISGWQKAHEYYHGKDPAPMPQGIQVDLQFAPQGEISTYWDKQFSREAEARALNAQRTKAAGPRVIVWGQDEDF